MGAIANHVGESGIRARFAEYVYRFLQIASRYEEDTLRLTYVGYPCAQYLSNSRTGQSTLGSGIRFSDEVTGLRELSLNAARIDGWRKSPSYEYWVQVSVPQFSSITSYITSGLSKGAREQPNPRIRLGASGRSPSQRQERTRGGGGDDLGDDV